MTQEMTLSQLEDQQPQSQEDLEAEIRDINADLGDVRAILCVSRKEEAALMVRRAWLRSRLALLKSEPTTHLTLSAEATPITTYPTFNGINQPSCPDCQEVEL